MSDAYAFGAENTDEQKLVIFAFFNILDIQEENLWLQDLEVSFWMRLGFQKKNANVLYLSVERFYLSCPVPNNAVVSKSLKLHCQVLP